MVQRVKPWTRWHGGFLSASMAGAGTAEVEGDGTDAADWLERSTATGVFYANDFSTFADSAALRTSNYGGTASQYQASTTLETRSGINGKVCRLHILKTADEGTPSYRHSWVGIGAQTKTTVKKRLFYQFQMYIPAYVLSHRFRTDASDPPNEPADLTSDVAMKFAILQEPDVSFALGEVVPTNARFRGFFTAYRMKPSGDAPPLAQAISGIPGGGSPDYRWQNAIDSGETVTTNADARRRYGPLQYSFPGTNNYGGGTLTAQGNPDAECSVNGVAWVPDAINVVEIFVDADADTVQMWHAVRGEAPTLVHSYVGTAELGQRTTNYTGAQLLPRLEQLIADATREDTFVDYGEVIASDDPIEFPGGFFPPGIAPSWATSLTLNAWTALPTTNTFESQMASNVGQYGNSGPPAVFTSWNGAEYLPTFGDFGSILHWGGGHTDYHGNEVYSFDLAALTWTRLNEPSVEPGWSTSNPLTNGITSDGKPGVPHTYYYLSNRNGKFITAKRQVHDNPASVYMVSQFDPETLVWTNSTATSSLNPTNDEGICYDSLRDGLWMVNYDLVEWAFYNFGTDAWTTYTQPTGAFNPRCGPVYCEGVDAVIAVGHSGPFGLNPASPAGDRITLTVSGTAPSFTTGDGIRWSNNLRAIVYYPSRGNSLYLFTPPASGSWLTGTWTWSQISVTGTTGTHSGGAGTYGKFNVVEWGSITVATVIGDVNGAYRAIRLQ